MKTEWYDRAKARMRDLGVRQEDLANALGQTRGAVGHYLTGRREPGLAQLLEIAVALKMNPEFLMTGEITPAMRDGIAAVSQSDATVGHIPRSDFRRVPVVGTASLGMDGYWADLEYPAGHGDGYFEFPTNDKDAYVLQVRGNSMHPAIRSGWYVVIEPNKQPQMGEFVMVKLADGRSTVKEYLWHRDGEYVLNAVATGERLVVQEADVEAIHHVGGILPPSGRQS